MRVAAFTMVRDESYFLPIWLRYYAQQFDLKNLTVIDHGSVDGCCDDLRCGVIKLPRTELDEKKRAALVSNVNSALLKAYDVVLYCDVDELIVPDLKIYSDLTEYLARNREPIISCVGIALLHIRELERPIRRDVSILSQRNFIQFHGLYCKPLITRTEVSWRVGFHGCREGHDSVISQKSDVFLYHLKAMDYDIAHSYLSARRKNVMSKASIEAGHSNQFRYDESEFDAKYFRCEAADVTDVASGLDFSEDLRRMANGQFSDFEKFGSVRRIPEIYSKVF